MKEKTKIVRAAGTVGGFTLLSRIMGFVRDMVMAYFFGAGMITDAFIAAFRLPNLLRRLFAEGSLVVSFVPVFSWYLEKKGKEEAFRLACSAFRLLSVILTVTVVAGVLFAPLIMDLLAPGFDDIAGKTALAILLTKIVFPYILFISLVALCMGILNTLGHFAAPALAPVMLNVSMIMSMVGASYFSDDKLFRIKALAAGVIIGGVLQLGLQVPFLLRHDVKLWGRAPFFHPGLKRIGKMMLPAVLGAGVYQINIVAGTILASLLIEGSMTWLYYADRVFQFPLGIFAISMGTAILPSLSRQASSGDSEGLMETFSYGLRFIFFITLPATLGLIILSEPIVKLLFMRGDFGGADVSMTSQALLYYAIGLAPVAGVRVAAPVFYANQDAKTPVRIAIVAIVSNIVISILLMGPMQHCGLALATSVASAINFILLLLTIRFRVGKIGGTVILVSLIKTMVCSVIMGLVVHGLAIYLIPAYTVSVVRLLGGTVACIGAGVAVYFLMAYLVKSRELNSALAMVRKR